MEDMRWQLAQAATATEHTWVLDAMAGHPQRAITATGTDAVSSASEVREILAAPFLAVGPTSHRHWPRQATAWKSHLLARHYERQMSFLHKEQTIRWYVDAQHAVCELSLLADSCRLHLR